MNVSRKQSNLLGKILCFVMIAVLSVSFLSVTLIAAGTNDSSGNASDYSFYQLASTLAGTLSTTLGERDAQTNLSTRFSSITTDSAGGLLAYTDKDNTRGIWGMFMAQLSLGSNTKDYKSLSTGLLGAIDAGSSTTKFTPYVCLGATLADMGLDQTGSAIETATMFSKRSMIGAVTMLAYLFSQAVCVVFQIVLDILRMLNPFQFFGAVSNIAERGAWNALTKNASVDTTNPTGGPFSTGGIATLISTFYDKFWIVGYVFITVLGCIAIFKFILPGGKNRMGFLKNWVIRAIFLFGGIAICGGTYTGLIEELKDDIAGGNTSATRVIASTFCDFEGWVMEGMPKPTTGITSIKARINNGNVTASRNQNTQAICYAINATSAPDGVLPTQLFTGTASVANAVNTVVDADGSGRPDVAVSLFGGATPTPTADAANTVEWTMDLLTRYSFGTKIYSSSYETVWKAHHWTTDAHVEVVQQFFDCFSTVDKTSTALANNFNGIFGYQVNAAATISTGARESAPVPIAGGTGYPQGTGTTAHTGTSVATGATTGGRPLSSTGTTGYTPYGPVTTNPDYVITDYWKGGFSAMSIYNYLNTTFGDSSLTVYSSSNSASNYVRDSHYSVNLVGKGLDSLSYLGVCLTLLITYGILGFYYGLGILIVNIKRGLRLIIAVPGAMLGSLASIAKVISYTVIMMLEILLNIFLYALTTELLYTVAIEVAGKIQTAATGFFGANTIITPIVGLVTILFLIWFTKELLALRKPIIKSLEEMADNVVQKFITGTSAAEQRALAARNGGNGGGAAGAGAGAGAGAAGGNKNKNGKEIGAGGMVAASLIAPGVGTAAVMGHNAKVRSKNLKDAKQAESEAKGQLLLSQMGLGGGTSSAVEEEKNLNNYQAAMRDAKKQTRREKAEAAKKIAAGTVQTAGAVAAAVATEGASATGSAKLGARGVKNMSEGFNDLSHSEINDAARKADIAAATASANGSTLSKNADKATGNTYANYGSNVRKFNAGEELKATAGAALEMAGGAAGGAAANSTATFAVDGAAGNIAGGGAGMAQIAGGGGGASNATAMLSQTQSVDTVTSLTAGANSVDAAGLANAGGKQLSGMPSNLVGSDATANGTMAVNTNTQLTEGANNIAGNVNGGGKSFNVGNGGQQSAQVSDSMNVSHNTSFNETMGGVQNAMNQGKQIANNLTSTSSYGSVQDDYNMVHQQNINTIRAGGRIPTEGNLGAMSASGSYQNANIQDVMNVNRGQQVNVNNNGGSGYAGSPAGGVNAQGVSQNLNATDTFNVNKGQQINVQNAGGSSYAGGSASGPNVQGMSQNIDANDIYNVNRGQQIRVNNVGGGGYAGGAGNFNAQGSNQNINTVDNVNVDRYQNVNVRNSGGGGYAGGHSSFSAQGTNQNINTTDTVNVNRSEVVNTRYTGGGSAGGARHTSAHGSTRSQNITDTTNINRNEVTNTSYSGGGNAGNAKHTSASGSSRSQTVTDKTNISRSEVVNARYSGGGSAGTPKAPRNINPDNNN